MKELKMKAWDKVKKEVFIIHGISFDIKSLAPSSIKVKGQSWEPAEKFQLLEWTGFEDSCGADVYEGDFIRISDILYQVVWNEAEACFELQASEDSSKRSISDITLGILTQSV